MVVFNLKNIKLSKEWIVWKSIKKKRILIAGESLSFPSDINYVTTGNQLFPVIQMLMLLMHLTDRMHQALWKDKRVVNYVGSWHVNSIDSYE